MLFPLFLAELLERGLVLFSANDFSEILIFHLCFRFTLNTIISILLCIHSYLFCLALISEICEFFLLCFQSKVLETRYLILYIGKRADPCASPNSNCINLCYLF